MPLGFSVLLSLFFASRFSPFLVFLSIVVGFFSELASSFTSFNKFSPQFLSIFVHISSGSSDEITGYHQQDREYK